MRDIFKGLFKAVWALLGIVLALPLAVPIASFLVTLEPVAKFYNLMLYYVDRLIDVFL